MDELRYTLLADGPSDQALIPILTWLLRAHGVTLPIQPEWADLRRLSSPPGRKLRDRILTSIELYPCDLLFVHRDAERMSHNRRVAEIQGEIAKIPIATPAICVVPVRMTEAWLLFDEAALRRAAGNPNGTNPLRLPNMTRVEQIPDPKEVLYNILREASGLQGRRQRKLRVAQNAQRITEFIDDFSPLRALPAFRALETDLERLLRQQGWTTAH